MSIDRTAQLKSMHLFGMAAAWQEWQTEYGFQQKPVIPTRGTCAGSLAGSLDSGGTSRSTSTQLELPAQGRTLSHSS